MLTERKHIALLGAVATLAFPAAASAGQHHHLPPRERLRADAHAGVDSATVGIAAGQAVDGPLLDPVGRYGRLLAATTVKIEHRHKVHARRRREAKEAREERESFENLPGGVPMSTMEAIAACESGGDPAAVSPGGTYMGLYQFDQGTWESVGGSGSPTEASAAEQTYRAALLYSESGSSPWPVCGQ